jgi:YVTN family beta-propeller protein
LDWAVAVKEEIPAKNRRSQMALGKALIRRVVLFGAFALGTFAVVTRLAVAQTPSPALLVVNTGLGTQEVHETDHSLAIIDPLTNKVVGRVPINGHPHEVAVSADGKFAFVTNSSVGADPKQIPDDTICVIDLKAQKVLRYIEIGPGSFPHDIVFAGGKVYFTAEGYKEIVRYDPVSNKIDWGQGTGHRGAHQLVISKDAKKIFVPSVDPNAVLAIELWDAPPADFPRQGHEAPGPVWRITPIPVGHQPEGIAMSPDGKEVWTLIRNDDSVSIIDVATRKVSQILDLKAKEPYRLAITPDGKRVLIATRNTGQLLVLDAVSRKEIKRIAIAGQILHNILITPDSARAYVASTGCSAQSDCVQEKLGGTHLSATGPVAIIDLKKLELVGDITSGERPEGMAWAQTR